MAIWSALLTGSSGLNAYGDAIGVVGDNVANVSTTGYRASRASFRDLLGGFGANGQRLGAGVQMAGAEVLHTEGSLLGTGRSLDLAIQGKGFFVLNGALRGIDGLIFPEMVGLGSIRKVSLSTRKTSGFRVMRSIPRPVSLVRRFPIFKRIDRVLPE